MNIKPKPGLKVRDPDLHDFLPESGRTVPDSTYWRRRLRDGDVQTVEQTASAAKRTTRASKAAAVTPAPTAEATQDKPADTQ